MPTEINIPSASISASTSSARAAFPAGHSKNAVYIHNTGSVPIFVKSGDSTVTATTSDSFVVGGTARLFYCNPLHTHIAAITASSTATVYFSEANLD